MKNLTLSELARAIWRRRFWFLVPLCSACWRAVAALQVLPRTYRAATQCWSSRRRSPPTTSSRR